MGLLMGKFRQILMELSAEDTPIFLFLGGNLSKYQEILTNLGTHTLILRRSGLGLLRNEQISSNFDAVIYSRHTRIFVSGH